MLCWVVLVPRGRLPRCRSDPASGWCGGARPHVKCRLHHPHTHTRHVARTNLRVPSFRFVEMGCCAGWCCSLGSALPLQSGSGQRVVWWGASARNMQRDWPTTAGGGGCSVDEGEHMRGEEPKGGLDGEIATWDKAFSLAGNANRRNDDSVKPQHVNSSHPRRRTTTMLPAIRT